MATIGAIRTALASRLATISGLRVAERWPGQVNPPAALVRPVSGEYDQTFGDGDLTVHAFAVVVIVQLGTLEAAQAALDEYLGPTGAKSLRQAVRADPTLGAVVTKAYVQGYRDYDTVVVNGVEYLGATVEIVVWA